MGWKRYAMFGFVVTGVALTACEHEITGSALPLNMQPAPPGFAGAYDFDLLGTVRGKACLTRGVSMGGTQRVFWVSGAGLERVARDSFTSQAIGAAAFEAIDGLANADSIVVTRVVTEAKGPDEICAYVYGRGIRLTKALQPSAPPAAQPPEVQRLPKPDRPDDLVNP